MLVVGIWIDWQVAQFTKVIDVPDIGNIKFMGLLAAQYISRVMVEGTRLLGHDRGSIESCDCLLFCIYLSHKALICPGHSCPFICKTTTLFFSLSTSPLASHSSTCEKPKYPDQQAVPQSHKLLWLTPPKPHYLLLAFG